MLTYGIFLFFSIFPIIHPKGLAQMPEGNMENTELLPLGVDLPARTGPTTPM